MVLEAAQRDVPVGDPALDPDAAVSLRDSGRVDVDLSGRSVTIVFDTAYAAKVHEAQSFGHPRGGKAKYLEGAALQALPLIEGVVASEVRKRFHASRDLTGHRRVR